MPGIDYCYLNVPEKMAAEMAKMLISKGIPFEAEPWPNGMWSIGSKKEHEKRLNEAMHDARFLVEHQ